MHTGNAPPVQGTLSLLIAVLRQTFSVSHPAALTLVWSPNGHSLAVAALDGTVVIWDVATLTQVGCIEGRRDLQLGRRTEDKVTAKKLESSA